jgi:hypothetical protein
MRTNLFLAAFVILAVAALPSCKQKSSDSSKVATLGQDLTDPKKLKDEVVNLIVSLPNNHETVTLINETGASYIAGLTEENVNLEKLLTRAQKVQTFGKVLFDLAYTDTYNQTGSFTKLLQIQEDLSRQLGYNELLELQKPYRDRFIANKSNRDSVDAIVASMLKVTNDYIQENGSASDITLIFASATVKALGTMTSLTLFARTNEKLIEILKKEKEHVNAAISILELTKGDPEIDGLLEKLRPIKDVFTSTENFTLDTVEQINQLTSKILG